MGRKVKDDLAELKDRIPGLQQEFTAVREHLGKLGKASAPRRRAVVERSKCTGCGICQEVCPQNAIRITYVANVVPDRCVGCGLCVENCPQGAIRLSGKKATPSKTG